jgi:hypothetical protein
MGGMYDPFNTLNMMGRTDLKTMTQSSGSQFPLLNLWAYQLLTTGKMDGTTSFTGLPDPGPLTSDQIGQITIIISIGMMGSAGIHQKGNIPKVGTLEYAMLTAYPGYSPIGNVSLNNEVIDSSGGVNNAGTNVNGFLGAINVPSVYMSRDPSDNPVFVLDTLPCNNSVQGVRTQMIQAYQLLKQQLASIQQYGPMSAGTFKNYNGDRAVEGVVSMALFADLMGAGLANIGSFGFNSYDFHATDVLRAPTTAGNTKSGAEDSAGLGNFPTEVSQAMAGAYFIGKKAFSSGRDAIVHFMTCSNRSPDYVTDSPNVSTITIIFKGNPNSPFKNLPQQMTLMPDGATSIYADAPGSNAPNYSGSDATALKAPAGMTVGNVEGGIIRAAGTASNQTPNLALEEPTITII